MPMHPPIARQQSSTRLLNLARGRDYATCKWSAAPIMPRFSCRAWLPWPCFSFHAVMATAIGQTNTRHPKTSNVESKCSRKLWHVLRHSPNIRHTPAARSAHGESSADFRVARFDDGINEIAALVIRKEGAFHRIDGDLFKIA